MHHNPLAEPRIEQLILAHPQHAIHHLFIYLDTVPQKAFERSLECLHV